MTNHIFSSDGTSLVFEDLKMYQQYLTDIKLLELKHYILIRNTYGIYASNQDKFVSFVSELNEWDGKAMERRLTTFGDELDMLVIGRGLI